MKRKLLSVALVFTLSFIPAGIACAEESLSPEMAVQSAFQQYIVAGVDADTALVRVQTNLAQIIALNSNEEIANFIQAELSLSPISTTPEQIVQQAFAALVSRGLSADDAFLKVQENLSSFLAPDADINRLVESLAANASTPTLSSQSTLPPTEVPSSQSTHISQPSAGVSTGNAENFNTYYIPEQQQTTARYVLNTSTHKIHFPSCEDVKRISPENYETTNLNIEEITAQNNEYTLCRHCNPY